MRTFAALLLISSALFAQIVDGIAAIVDGKPVTLYEIEKLSRTKGIPPREALELLIQKRLEEEQIKKLGVSVNDTELEREIERFARQKGLDYYELRNAVEEQGIDWYEYKREFREQLLRKKLYEKILASHNRPTPQQIREYYENHPEEFTLAQKATLIKYVSPSKEVLERIRQNPLYRPENPDLLATGEEVVTLADLEPAFASVINRTPEGSFTPIIPLPQNQGYLLILVKSKEGEQKVPFEQVQGYIAERLAKSGGTKSVKEYFDKLRASADVKIIRLPKE